MSEPYVAEIRLWAGNFAPRSYSFCNGNLLPIAQNTALFSLIGTTYGGDGRTTTALPNLQGRAPMHPGRGPGLTPRRLGEKDGVPTVTLSTAQMPNHNHNLEASEENGDDNDPSGRLIGRAGIFVPVGTGNVPNPVNMALGSLPAQGGNEAHTNLQPYLALSFIIALQGVYPSRS